MPDQAARSIAVVVEASADRQIACDLADRLLCDKIDWIEPKVLGNYRRYRGFEETDAQLKWKHVRSLAEKHHIKAHGFFRGEPGDPDALAARKALLLMRRAPREPRPNSRC